MNGELEWMKVKIESTQNPLTLWFSARSQQVFHLGCRECNTKP